MAGPAGVTEMDTSSLEAGGREKGCGVAAACGGGGRDRKGW